MYNFVLAIVLCICVMLAYTDIRWRLLPNEACVALYVCVCILLADRKSVV